MDPVTGKAGGRPSAWSRRQILMGGAAALGGAFLVGGLSGCAPQVASAGGIVDLKYWHLLSGGDGIRMTEMVKEANDSGDGFDVTATVLAWGQPYYTKLAMASVGGRAPDVAIMHAARVPGFAPGGLLDPWDTDRLAELGVTQADFEPRVWDKGVVDGKLYSIALDSHPFILMYNTDVAAQAGVLGGDGQLEEITSPDRFLEVMRAMQAVTGEHALSYGYLGDGAQMWRLFYTFYKQMGGDMELPTGGEVVYDRDKAVASLEYIQTLLDGTIATPSGDAGTAIAEFAGAKSGAIVTGVWELPTFQKAKVPFDAMPIPNLFGTPATFADSHAFVLPHQGSPDPVKREKTYAFVADLLKNSLQWAGAGHIPAYKPIVDSPEYAELLPQAHYADAAAQIEYDPVAYFTGSGSDFQTYFAENVQNVFLGRQEAGVGLDAFIRQIDALLAKPNPL
ncbi:extracellular solute-binding protein [Clavibacter michiganensis]|uniref:extracellular solute-binding protein n=1 Tax=Clavibacter michiganensis TaxID=28447 RepID=UPI000A396188|nr:extracellular solute-binding protein [Clavibacter michiganensis]MWJ36509.1 carbohydrate-binding protein [Clavibacter michiganensis subsp. michiganensis]OUD94398.1 Maltodextrin-binding protein MdxE precursor [Clavibacter michiganensis subsp. michiganensis]OUE13918.1 Maltodextrin-binding protein MdxE precursor [Clavibacter michiganensis subsp. michiganensis]